MCKSNPWCHSFIKALILKSVCVDSQGLKDTRSGMRTVQSIPWAKLTCISPPTCTCIWSRRTAFVWAAPEEQHVSLQAQMDWRSRGFVLLCRATANVNQGSTATANCVWGVSGGNRLLPAMDTSRAPFGWGRVSYCHAAQLHLHEHPCRFISPVKQARDLG